MDGDRLTPAQRRVLHYIEDEIIRSEAPPTFRAIASALGFRAIGTVQDHVKALIRKGFLEKEDGRARGIRLPERYHAKAKSIPILGQIAAGIPREASEVAIGNIPVPQHLAKKKNLFALKVHGDSMKDAGILDGDLVIARQEHAANEKDIVVAIVDGEATVKRLIQKNGKTYLMPENPEYKPIPILSEESMIQGVVVSVQRYLE